MKAEIEIALRMLLKSDSTIPPDGRIDRAVDVIRGIGLDVPDLVKMQELRKVLHMSDPAIRNLMDAGRLNRIMGAGERCLGVSRDSLRRFIRGEVRTCDGMLINE